MVQQHHYTPATILEQAQCDSEKVPSNLHREYRLELEPRLPVCLKCLGLCLYPSYLATLQPSPLVQSSGHVEFIQLFFHTAQKGIYGKILQCREVQIYWVPVLH